MVMSLTKKIEKKIDVSVNHEVTGDRPTKPSVTGARRRRRLEYRDVVFFFEKTIVRKVFLLPDRHSEIVARLA